MIRINLIESKANVVESKEIPSRKERIGKCGKYSARQMIKSERIKMSNEYTLIIISSHF